MRWRILGLLFAARIALGLQFQTLASVGDDLVVAYGLGYAEIGTLIGLFMVPGLFLALPVGFSDRYASDKTLTGLGLGLLAVGGLTSGLAPDTWTIGAGRLIAGVGFLLTSLYFVKMIADWFTGLEIATAMGVLVMSWPLGIAIGQIGHEWLAQTLSWRTPFYVAFAYCAVAAVAVFAFYRAAEGSVRPAKQQRLGFDLTGHEWRLVILAGAAWGVFNAGYVIYLTYGPLMLEIQGHTAFAAAAVISVGSWLMIFSGALCGMIADRTGRRNTVLTVCMAGAVVALLLLSEQGTGLAVSLLFGLLGMAPAGVIMALAGEAVRAEKRAVGMGVFLTVYYVIMAAVPPISGRLYDLSGSPWYPILLAAILFAAVVPATLIFGCVRRSQSNLEVQTVKTN